MPEPVVPPPRSPSPPRSVTPTSAQQIVRDYNQSPEPHERPIPTRNVSPKSHLVRSPLPDSFIPFVSENNPDGLMSNITAPVVHEFAPIPSAIPQTLLSQQSPPSAPQMIAREALAPQNAGSNIPAVVPHQNTGPGGSHAMPFIPPTRELPQPKGSSILSRDSRQGRSESPDRSSTPLSEMSILQRQAEDDTGIDMPYPYPLKRNHSFLSVIQEQSDTGGTSPVAQRLRSLSPGIRRPQEEAAPISMPTPILSYIPAPLDGNTGADHLFESDKPDPESSHKRPSVRGMSAYYSQQNVILALPQDDVPQHYMSSHEYTWFKYATASPHPANLQRDDGLWHSGVRSHTGAQQLDVPQLHGTVQHYMSIYEHTRFRQSGSSQQNGRPQPRARLGHLGWPERNLVAANTHRPPLSARYSPNEEATESEPISSIVSPPKPYSSHVSTALVQQPGPGPGSRKGSATPTIVRNTTGSQPKISSLDNNQISMPKLTGRVHETDPSTKATPQPPPAVQPTSFRMGSPYYVIRAPPEVDIPQHYLSESTWFNRYLDPASPSNPDATSSRHDAMPQHTGSQQYGIPQQDTSSRQYGMPQKYEVAQQDTDSPGLPNLSTTRSRTPEIQPVIPAITSSSSISAVPNKNPKGFVPKEVDPVPFGYHTPMLGHGRHKFPLGRPNPDAAYSLTARTPRLPIGMATRDGLPAVTPEHSPEARSPVIPPSVSSSSPMAPPGVFDEEHVAPNPTGSLATPDPQLMAQPISVVVREPGAIEREQQPEVPDQTRPRLMYAQYRPPSQSSQSLPVGMIASNPELRSRLETPWAFAPREFQPPKARRAASVTTTTTITRTARTTSSGYDLRSPRSIFEPIPSDEPGPDPRPHELLPRYPSPHIPYPSPQYAGLPDGGGHRRPLPLPFQARAKQLAF
ncbi:hypothetical protein FS837_009706 [Tulasnella sp. UAMH 9824]|nr:hypothetical protein FS837_009706 [Tulasnella sp. UAMH 9824]